MKNFIKAIKEVRSSLSKILLFEAFINAIIIFLVFFLGLSLFDISFLYAFIPSGIYLIAAASLEIRENKIPLVEHKFKFLNEKLRTAADYSDVENPVVNALHEEVIGDLNKVDEGAFFETRRVYFKSGVIVALCFLILVLAPVSLKIPSFKDLNLNVDLPISLGDDSGEPVFQIGGPAGSGVIPGSQNIYSTKTVAKLGDQKLDVEIRPVGFEINVRNVIDAEDKDFIDQYPDEVFAVSSQTYQEKIPKDQQELVKNYFKQLAEG